MISIVIPAYNEEKRIQNTLKLYSEFFFKKYDCEIIIISDGQDGTASIVKEIGKNYSQIKLFEFKTRLGKGGAIIKGFTKSKGDIVGFVDADEAVTPEQFEKLIYEINGYDAAIASRRAKGSIITKRQPLKREIMSKGFNLICNCLFNLKIKDTQCGAKVFKKETIDKILPELKSTGFEFDVELLWRIKKKGALIKEVPIIWQHGDKSSFSLKYSPIMLINLIKRRSGF